MKRDRWLFFLFFLIGFLGSHFWEITETRHSIANERDLRSLTLTAVGDIVMHLPIVNSARKPDGSYDFRPIFYDIKPYLTQADLTAAVLETQLDAPGQKHSGYPCFNTPGAIADSLFWSGIDIVFLAHNHSLDQGIAGINNSIAYLERIGLAYTGCRSNPGEARYRILEKNRIKLAFFSHTTTTNGIPLPQGKEWVVNMLDFNQIAADIAEAKAAGADGIVFALHTGIEYQREPTTDQIEIIEKLISLGVDIVLGSHVHVIQPIEGGTVDGLVPGRYRTYFIAYSLGNFLSNQRWRYSDTGLMVNLKLVKEATIPGIRIESISYMPLWTYRYQEGQRFRYRIIALDQGGTYRTRFKEQPELINQLDEVKRDTEELIREWRWKRPNNM